MSSRGIYPNFRQVSEDEFAKRCHTKLKGPPTGKMLLPAIYLIAEDTTPPPGTTCSCGMKLTRRNVIKHGTCRTNLVDYDPDENRPIRCSLLQQRWRCRNCNKTHITTPLFKHPRHEATKRAVRTVERLLRNNELSYQEISRRTGLDTKIVSDIDRESVQSEIDMENNED